MPLQAPAQPAKGIDIDTPLWQLTVGQFRTLIANEIASGVRNMADDVRMSKTGGKWLVSGIDGLASLLGCGRTAAQAIKSSGMIDAAVIQHGRRFVVDAELALEIIKNQSKI